MTAVPEGTAESAY